MRANQFPPIAYRVESYHLARLISFMNSLLKSCQLEPGHRRGKLAQSSAVAHSPNPENHCESDEEHSNRYTIRRIIPHYFDFWNHPINDDVYPEEEQDQLKPIWPLAPIFNK